MIKQATLTLFCLLVGGFAFGQGQTIRGVILEQATQQPLPYVNVGVVGQNIGTVSDMEGRFTLEIPNAAKQKTLRFSMLGYEELVFESLDQYLKNNAAENARLMLKQEDIQLPDVKIAEKKYKEKILGSQTETRAISCGFSTDKLGSEIGILIKLGKKKPAWIQDFNFYIAKNAYDSAFFRINVYSLDEEGYPETNLLQQSIIVIFTDEYGSVTVDLKDQLLIVEEDFIIGLEYIRDLEQEDAKTSDKLDLTFSAAFLGKPIFFRQTSQGDWEKTRIVNPGFNVLVKY